MRRRDLILGIAGATAWPLATSAQPKSVPVVGYLISRGPDDASHLAAAFRRGLRDEGFIDGQNVRIEYRWGQGQFNRLPALALELCSAPLAVLAATGGEPAVLAAASVCKSTPIVFAMSSDPIRMGLVESYNRPGRNATGVNVLTTTLEQKRLGLLHDLVPAANEIGFFVNSNFGPAEMQVGDAQEAARTMGVKLRLFRIGSDSDITSAFETIKRGEIRAIAVAGSPFFDTRRNQLTALAASNKIPTMYHIREYAVAGGLVSYGVDLVEVHRQVGLYTGAILKGAKPGDLPVRLPTKFELVINAKAAKGLNLTVPPHVLAIADELIE